MELMDAIRGRRSVRKYRREAVPDEALKVVLEAVRWAPSWANTQCWEIVIVKERNQVSQLADTLPSGNPGKPAMLEAPLVLVLCARKGIAGYYRGKPATDRGDWFMFDSGIAMQNLCLAAHSLGLGTVIIGLFDHKKAERILGVPEDLEVVAMTPLGYPAQDVGPTKRREITEFVHYDRYGNRAQ